VAGRSTGRLVLQFDADVSPVLAVVSEVAVVANSAVAFVCDQIDSTVSLAAVVVLPVVVDNMVPGFDFVVAHYRVGVDILAALVVDILVALGVDAVAVVDVEIAIELADADQVQLRLVYASFS